MSDNTTGENTEQTQPPRPLTLKERMAQQLQQPSTPPSAYIPPPSIPSVNPPPQAEPKRGVTQHNSSAKTTQRASHYVDDDGIAWTRTGLTLPAAFWRGIVAYVNQAKLQWEPGQEKTTQQQLIVEAIGIWLNDHRSNLPHTVNTECDQVREKLRNHPQ